MPAGHVVSPCSWTASALRPLSKMQGAMQILMQWELEERADLWQARRRRCSGGARRG